MPLLICTTSTTPPYTQVTNLPEEARIKGWQVFSSDSTLSCRIPIASASLETFLCYFSVESMPTAYLVEKQAAHVQRSNTIWTSNLQLGRLPRPMAYLGFKALVLITDDFVKWETALSPGNREGGKGGRLQRTKWYRALYWSRRNYKV